MQKQNTDTRFVRSLRKLETATKTRGVGGRPPKDPQMSRASLYSDCLPRQEGSGWKTPKDGEMTISLKACKMDGTVIEDKGSFENLGPNPLGRCGCLKTWDL